MMKKYFVLFFVVLLMFCTLCGCFKRGPYAAPLTQTPDQVVTVELLDGRNEHELLNNINYDAFVIYTLTPEETATFLEGLESVAFYIPAWEPSRHLGEIVARIQYKDGCSDILGSNRKYYIDSNFNILDVSVYYPDKESFYSLFAQFVDAELLPGRN